MMKSFKLFLILFFITVSGTMIFPKTLAETSDQVETVGFNSTPIKDNKDFVQQIFRCVEGLYFNHTK